MLIRDYESSNIMICIWFVYLIILESCGRNMKVHMYSHLFLFQMKTLKFASEIYWPLAYILFFSLVIFKKM